MLNFTQEEKKAIVFLAVIALLGIGVDFSVKQFSEVRSIACFAQDLGKVDLNSADKRILMGISGIGERTAQRIIDYRDGHSGFSDPDELKGIKGISESRFTKIREYLIVK